MNLEVKGIHYEVSDHVRELVDKKLLRIDFANDFIIDQLFTITKTKNGYKVESNTNFRWGTSAHIRVDTVGLGEGLDILFDKLVQKIRKEKDKIQDHGPHPTHETAGPQ